MKLKTNKSWSQNWEHEGHILSACSENESVYLTIKNETEPSNSCFAMTYKQLFSLKELIAEAEADLLEDDHWDTKTNSKKKK